MLRYSDDPGKAGNVSRPLPEASGAMGWPSRLAHSRIGLVVLAFGEATFVPLPIEALVAPLMVAYPKRAMAMAVLLWLGNLAGALAFYVIGFTLAEPLVEPVLGQLGLLDAFAEIVQTLSGENLFWSVFMVSLLPAPLQLATLGAGAIGGHLLIFLAAIASSRAIRYAGLALLARIAGQAIEAHIRPRKRTILLGTAVVMLGGWGFYQLIANWPL